MALPRVTPTHRDPSDSRAPQQAAVPTDREDCNLACDHVKYKYVYTNTCHTGTDVKKSAFTGTSYGTSTIQTSLALTPMQLGHEASETQRDAVQPLTSRSRRGLAQTCSSPSGAVNWE